MKKTGICPKCASTEIRILRQRTWGTLIPTSNIFLRSIIYSRIGGVLGAVYSSWFICLSCGFMETWIERDEDLAKIREKLNAR